MSKLASALFSTADANEFRFARFYIVCEAVPLGTLESPLIVCGLSDTLRESPNVEETRNQKCSHPAGRNTHFLQRMFHMQFHPKSASCAPVILLIKVKYGMLITAVPFSI